MFAVSDLIILDAIHRGVDPPPDAQKRIRGLEEAGALERISRRKLVLSKRFYAFKGKRGEYTRRAGLDRETRKELLLKHIRDNAKSGAPFEDLQQVLPDANRSELKRLLAELRAGNGIHLVGQKRGARWFPGPLPPPATGGATKDEPKVSQT